MASIFFKTSPNQIKTTTSRKVYLVINAILLLLIAVICILPFLNLLAISLSDKDAVIANKVFIWPVGFNLKAYSYLITNSKFFTAFGISILRVVLGTIISLFVTMLMAYPLAFAKDVLKGRFFYIALVIVAMFFSGGLIPTFILINKIGLGDSIWALVLPGAMNCWNMILFINFFRNVPKEMLESAKLDGAGHFTILFKIIIPLSLPVVATVALFCVIGNWNAWFDGYLYMSNPDKWPLQTYIYHMMEELKNFQLNKDKMTPEEIEAFSKTNDTTLRAAQVFIAMIPVLLIYPIASKYFMKGILLGGVKE